MGRGAHFGLAGGGAIVQSIGTCLLTPSLSDSPLNAEAAELWDKDPEEFKRKVTARHRDIDDD